MLLIGNDPRVRMEATKTGLVFRRLSLIKLSSSPMARAMQQFADTHVHGTAKETCVLPLKANHVAMSARVAWRKLGAMFF